MAGAVQTFMDGYNDGWTGAEWPRFYSANYQRGRHLVAWMKGCKGYSAKPDISKRKIKELFRVAMGDKSIL